MKLPLRMCLLLSITVFITGCKLAVINVEGGSVLSDVSGTCLAGNICIVDVTQPDFAEGFRALSDNGWYFEKWNSGDRFFCAGSTNPNCYLNFHGFEESKEVEDMVASSEVFYLMPVFRRSAIFSVDGKITVNGKQWLQPKDFVNYSYDQVSAVCPDGICSGFLPGSTFDLTGYIWASADDANALFNAYLKGSRQILEDFVYTGVSASLFYIYAMLSDPPNKDPVYDRVYIAFANPVPEILPWEIAPYPIAPSTAGDDFGAWFWRPID